MVRILSANTRGWGGLLGLPQGARDRGPLFSCSCDQSSSFPSEEWDFSGRQAWKISSTHHSLSAPPRPDTHQQSSEAFPSDSDVAEPLVSEPVSSLSYFYDAFVVLAYFSVYSVWE